MCARIAARSCLDRCSHLFVKLAHLLALDVLSWRWNKQADLGSECFGDLSEHVQGRTLPARFNIDN